MHVRRVEVGFAGPAQPQLFAGLSGIEDLQADGHRVAFTVRGSFEPVAEALAGHGVVDLVSREPTLEEVFLAHYQDRAEEARG